MQLIHFSVVIISAVAFSSFIVPLLYLFGYVPVSTGGSFWVYFAVITIFCLVQFFYRGFLQLFFSAPLFATTLVDVFSFLPVIILYLAIIGRLPNIPVIPSKLVPFVVLAVFSFLHIFFKLVSLYTSTCGKPDSRLYSLIWFIPSLVVLYLLLLSLVQWKHALIQHRYLQPELISRVGESPSPVFSAECPEGSYLSWTLPTSNTREYFWYIRSGKDVKTSNITLYIFPVVTTASCLVIPVEVTSDRWTEVCIPSDWFVHFPMNVVISWATVSYPSFVVRHGLVPQLTLLSLEDLISFITGEGEQKGTMDAKTIFIDGPYYFPEATGQVILQSR